MSYKQLDVKKTYLVTGAAGFIGYYLSQKLLDQGCRVIGIDNVNEYYDVKLKLERLNRLESHGNFTFIKGDISDKETITNLFKEYSPDIVVNLAAQAGVRYSIENPDAYIQSNIIGFYNILEACRHYPVDHLLYASSSSVYGANKKVPFEETDFVDQPVSLYASTKKSNELMAHTYSHLYKIPSTGLRFFTVYGPMGRPDMAYFGFTDKYFNGDEIKIFNNGDFDNDLYRDFTYVDDIVEGIELLLSNPFKDEGEVPHKVYNIGNSNPEKLMIFIGTLEKCLSNSLGKSIEFKKKFEPIMPGDVPATYASTALLEKAVGFKPKTSIEEGLQNFTDWYCEYYNKK
ncbi:SDR family NAD(P)-dependent oxidoreductase [Planomicrobium okeanokoites]|uniref:SDR family NAD(P)-dependent oxidoreductase n=1 Tax=Planomicrobium okeanokoites TaxID=244 RepID=UPI0009FFAAB3|nr:SDR family NAD(P)-dependent oxidoreductase [Planomicrobium okeanokoites]